jgi:hypothetical protein
MVILDIYVVSFECCTSKQLDSHHPGKGLKNTSTMLGVDEKLSNKETIGLVCASDCYAYAPFQTNRHNCRIKRWIFSLSAFFFSAAPPLPRFFFYDYDKEKNKSGYYQRELDAKNQHRRK